MQDHYAPEIHTSHAGAQVIVHPRLVDWLRRATYAEIGTAAEALDAAVTAGDREAHRGQFQAAMQSLRESYGLLDMIGWAKTDPPVAVPIELGESSWALVRALDSAQELAGEEVYEVHATPTGRRWRARPSACASSTASPTRCRAGSTCSPCRKRRSSSRTSRPERSHRPQARGLADSAPQTPLAAV